jgi:hypothetical protein
MAMYIHEQADWPQFRWQDERLAAASPTSATDKVG